MHYTTVKDAALYAAIAVAVTVQDKGSPAAMTMCYIIVFLSLAFFLEAARDWEERRRKSHDKRTVE